MSGLILLINTNIFIESTITYIHVDFSNPPKLLSNFTDLCKKYPVSFELSYLPQHGSCDTRGDLLNYIQLKELRHSEKYGILISVQYGKYRFINDNNFDISLHKVKSQSMNLGNDLADSLCKTALLLEKSDKFKCEINVNNNITWEHLVFWRGMPIKQNPSDFMKNVNRLRYKAEWLTLDINRSFRLNIPDIDIVWMSSLDIIMKEYRESISFLNTIYCNIKNYLGICPMMTLLNNVILKFIKVVKCCRCNMTIETWTLYGFAKRTKLQLHKLSTKLLRN